MPDLMVQIDDQTLPLKDCAWIQSAPCGCIVAITMAAAGGDLLATEEQAHKRLTPSKREREKDIRDGYTIRLITMAHYRDRIGAEWECGAHRKSAAS